MPHLDVRVITLAALALATLVAFVAYAVDKRRAGTGAGRRVPEVTLLGLGALGPVGAWAAVLGLRHKTRKPWFLTRLVLASTLVPALLWAMFLR